MDLFHGDPPGRNRTALPPGAGEAILERLLGMAGALRRDPADEIVPS